MLQGKDTEERYCAAHLKKKTASNTTAPKSSKQMKSGKCKLAKFQRPDFHGTFRCLPEGWGSVHAVHGASKTSENMTHNSWQTEEETNEKCQAMLHMITWQPDTGPQGGMSPFMVLSLEFSSRVTQILHFKSKRCHSPCNEIGGLVLTLTHFTQHP